MNNMRYLRKKKGLTQTQIAQYIGISQNNYSYWENGKVKIDDESIKKLADFFGVSTDYLLGRTPTLEPEIKAIGGFMLNENGKIPLVGRVVAGVPVETSEYIEGYVYVGYTNPEDYFALRVSGNSMVGAGITEKSILIVHKQSYAENGDIIVASVDGESTVKRYRMDKGIVMLMPENPAYTPIIVTEKNVFYIFGKVVQIRTDL